MDLSSPHLFYVISAFVSASGILGWLLFWAFKADRKIRLELKKLQSHDT